MHVEFCNLRNFEGCEILAPTILLSLPISLQLNLQNIELKFMRICNTKSDKLELKWAIVKKKNEKHKYYFK